MEGGGRAEKGESDSVPPLSIIGRNFFKKETDMSLFVGMKIFTKYGQEGVIDAPFGKSGKFKATFAHPRRVHLAAVLDAVTEEPSLQSSLPAPVATALAAYKAATAGGVAAASPDVECIELPPAAVPVAKANDPLFLRFRKYMYAPKEEKAAGRAAMVQ